MSFRACYIGFRYEEWLHWSDATVICWPLSMTWDVIMRRYLLVAAFPIHSMANESKRPRRGIPLSSRWKHPSWMQTKRPSVTWKPTSTRQPPLDLLRNESKVGAGISGLLPGGWGTSRPTKRNRLTTLPKRFSKKRRTRRSDFQCVGSKVGTDKSSIKLVWMNQFKRKGTDETWRQNQIEFSHPTWSNFWTRVNSWRVERSRWIERAIKSCWQRLWLTA